ncbi:hypothetical protein PTTG_11784 [Puccinia triticina 1-1 BBBD Race 1]|uniref:Uncharacterized protein n=1 Tax=Puccinia triticina (isolate 1-1 / race 1 (BBBD)) TaxID=630390 RepID=A0A180G420_PUCT1|nr:hypothetical protein PTTG_11784 [Puccinia triticina 1-1 BBBD Race 1]
MVKMDSSQSQVSVGFERGSDYKDTSSLNSQALHFLQKQHSSAITKVVDFDLLAVFLMQGFDAGHHICKIIGMVEGAFTEATPPQNMLMYQIVNAAKLVKTRIQTYQDQLKTNPSTRKPFCLRFPTYELVLQHSSKLEKMCEVLPTDVMVVLIDEGGICVGVGLPPKPPSDKTGHMPCDVRAIKTLDTFVSKNVVKIKEDEAVRIGPNENTAPHPQSPFPLSSNPKGLVRSAKGAKDSMCSYQTYGFGLGSPLSAGAADKKIPCSTHQIKTEELQGHGEEWKSEPEPHLPEPMRSETGATLCGLVELRYDTVFYSKLSYWINRIFLPESSAVAERAIEFLSKNRSSAVKEAIEQENNRIVASRTVSVNVQPYTHHDINNALLMDSVFFFGNHLGGEFILPSLGVAYCGLHGYSFHGPFGILLHGVAQYYFLEEVKEPRRFSLAMWSRATTFSAIARGAAYKAGNQIFSDPAYWLPLYPEYSLEKVRDLFKEECKIDKKIRKIESIKNKQMIPV